ncbi:Mitochondrial import inner membrane translocase subunit TIM14-2 [Acorus calamus]|uniref:Mitochondrial import inner membrane translocase subunit TIM14-2 n=1 Tax=Acorus calamus TaxID=4465 RepID=A0AAV9DTZ5_ACOCL|nr:Mitochondrial import inner membrane translocase subunit TIM14-2 [Acorus calamus]
MISVYFNIHRDRLLIKSDRLHPPLRLLQPSPMEAAAAPPSTTARAPTRPSFARSSSSRTAAWSPPPPPRSPPHGRGSISPYDFDGALPGVVSPPPKGPRKVPRSPFKVTKLCDLGAGDSVCSVGWAQRGTHLAVGTNNGKVEVDSALKTSETAQSLLNAEREHSSTIMFSDEEFNSLQLQLPKGLEMGIGTMTRGEKAIVYVSSQCLTQSPFMPAVDGFEEILFYVELVHFIEVRDMLGDERLIKRRIVDGKGAYVQREFELLGFEMPKENKLFKDGKFELAKAKYEKARVVDMNHLLGHQTSNHVFTNDHQLTSAFKGQLAQSSLGFQIFGEAIPGSTLRACGYPTYGTSLCIFQWVRHHYNGTPQYVEAATNPEYVVTADDVGATISAKCIPMDDKGNQDALAGKYTIQAWQAFKARPVGPQMEAVTAEKVKEAHRRVMVANHPDTGGSGYLASKINEAKDVLFGKAKNSGSAF